MDNQEERVALQSIPVRHIPSGLHGHNVVWDDLYFPINDQQVRDILGQILTQVEAMNLQPASERAVKAIFTQMVWRWFDKATDNAVTSAPAKDGKPCIAPIKLIDCTCDGSGRCTKCALPSSVRGVYLKPQPLPEVI